MKLKQIASALMVLGMSPLAFADFTIQDIRVEGLQRTEPSTVFNYLPVKSATNSATHAAKKSSKLCMRPVFLTMSA